MLSGFFSLKSDRLSISWQMGYVSAFYLLGEDTAFIFEKGGLYVDIGTPEEVRKLNYLQVSGQKVEGAWIAESGTHCLVLMDVLMELLEAKKECIRLQKIHSHLPEQIIKHSEDKKELDRARARIKELEDRLADAGVVIESLKKELETARKPDMSEIRALSADVRAKKRDRAFALTLSLSIRGYGNSRIIQELSGEGYGTSKASIARALSVTKDGDRQRIKDIMAQHPDCFEGISEQDFERWFSERYEKLTKAAKIREENKSWGS